MRQRSIMNYGAPGTGKTAFGVSSFWDFIKKEPVPGQTGRLLLIGRESNPDLDLPEESIKRFPMTRADPMGFVGNLKTYLKTCLAVAKKTGDGPTNLVMDGWSELALDFLWGHVEANASGDKWDKWSDLKRDLTEIMLMWDPIELKANLFSTARVTKFKKPTQAGGKTIEGDPDWMSEFSYHPSLDGFWRDNIGHYFNNIVYHEATYKTEVKKGEKVLTPQWVSHWLPSGDYLVKNTAAHKWPLTDSLVNAGWPEVRAALEEMEDKG